MKQEVTLRIILERPPPGVAFCLQKGGGNSYERVQSQMSAGNDLTFEFDVRLGEQKDGQPNFLGPFTQGPADGRFVYIDIGTMAGQIGSCWSRRLKVPLRGISWEMINNSRVLVTRVAGTAKDGSPTCATVKPFNGWSAGK